MTIGIAAFVVLATIASFVTIKAIDGSSRFTAVILSIHGNSVVVEPVAGEAILLSADRIYFGTGNLDDIGADVGDTITIKFKGFVRETYPAQIDAVRWSIVKKASANAYSPPNAITQPY